MSIPGAANPLLLASAASTQYTVSRSLRFNSSDSGYLSRTPSSAGNRKTWTWSGWVKKTVLFGANYADIFSAVGVTSDSGLFVIEFRGENLALTGGTTVFRQTTQVFRDVSAWFHLVVTVDTTDATANNRIRLYVNGSEVTTFSTLNNPAQNADLGVNQTVQHNISSLVPTSTRYFDGYLAEIHFIDGQALTPSSFTEVSATTGQLIPKRYTGTFTGNSFWLPFSDNSSTTSGSNVGIGKDFSGLGNYWNTTNLSVTAGAGNDSLVDTPTSYGTDTGAGGEVRGNYATLNPLAGTGSLANGNLDFTSSGSGFRSSTIGISSGKWYWEVLIGSTPTNTYVGLYSNPNNEFANSVITGTGGNRQTNAGGTFTVTSSTFQAGDIFGVAADLDAGTVTWYRNGSVAVTLTGATLNTATWYPGTNVNAAASTAIVYNFGQRPFAYTAPSGFKALCDTNLPAPVVAKPSSAFDCVTYTGTGATLTPTSSLGFSPDLVWIKSRSAATDHTIYDAVRGTQARLESNNTDPEVTSDGGLTAFNSNGFTLGTLAQVNTNAATYVAWCWDEAVADGFDIVTYTGNGANRTIAHSLGVAPSFMIVKQRTAASATNWAVWHSSLANTEYLLLNSTAAKATGATYWNSTSPTSTNFSLGTAADVNTNNGTYVAYLWSSVVGYSSFGSFVASSTTSGVYVHLGFRARWILIKASTSVTYGSWRLVDTARSPYNGVKYELYPNLSNAETDYGAGDWCDILSNGFVLKQDFGAGTYIYAAFAESPFQYARAR